MVSASGAATQKEIQRERLVLRGDKTTGVVCSKTRLFIVYMYRIAVALGPDTSKQLSSTEHAYGPRFRHCEVHACERDCALFAWLPADIIYRNVYCYV